MELDFF